MQILNQKIGNIFEFCHIFEITNTELAVFCSVIWRKTIWEDGGILFWNLTINI